LIWLLGHAFDATNPQSRGLADRSISLGKQ
jgi:hypothetical protein